MISTALHIVFHTHPRTWSRTSAHTWSHTVYHTQLYTAARTWSRTSDHTWSRTAAHMMLSTDPRRRFHIPGPVDIRSLLVRLFSLVYKQPSVPMHNLLLLEPPELCQVLA